METKINTVVILGGTSDRGLTKAKSLISTFNRIILVDPNRQALQSAIVSMADAAKPEQIVAIQANLSVESDLEKLAHTVKYKYGGASQIIDCSEDINSLSQLRHFKNLIVT